MWDWDDGKRQANLAKHGLEFAALGDVDLSALRIDQDLRRDYGEARFSFFFERDGRLHHVTFTPLNGRFRLISFRRANKREQRKWASRNL
jgi:uncharacterized DUF497 family protein